MQTRSYLNEMLFCSYLVSVANKFCSQHDLTNIPIKSGTEQKAYDTYAANRTLFVRASASCSKILNDKIYFNTAKNSRATQFSRVSASCSKILNDKKYIFNTVKILRTTLFIRVSASYSKILDVKNIFNTVKISRANSVFHGKRGLLKNPE